VFSGSYQIPILTYPTKTEVTCTLKERSYRDRSTGSQNSAKVGTGLGQGMIDAVRLRRLRGESRHRTGARINHHHPWLIKLHLLISESSTRPVLDKKTLVYLHEQVCIVMEFLRLMPVLLSAHSCQKFLRSTESSFSFNFPKQNKDTDLK
jgi:hypothetical protein